ncbi:protein melted-like isoform X1 [Artemia franciscana]|uniref:protein melted-like isoform X1 n=2 Tax=Artemia franciscana TaxID=6661 RepID=UPI0032DB5E85
MRDVLKEILLLKNLSHAGDLFKLSDGEILQDIYEIIPALKDIISDDTFVYNKSDHTLVDITITRLTSAIRQSGSKECNIRLILDLLDTCLSHTLTPNEKKQDPPHSKISAELLSCLFKENYDKTDLMKMCIPTAIKFLHKGNKELSKNIATYLWLAASANAFILAMNIQPVIDSLITGNYCLTRVLPLVYVFHPDPINDHIMVLASLLHGMDIVEKLALLDLLLRVAKTKPSLLESSISQIVDCLSIDQLVSLSLQVLLSFSYWKTLPLAAHFQRIYEAGLKSESIATTCFASQLIARIGLLSLDRARSALEFVSDQLSNADTVSSVSLLKEILNLVDAYPVLLSEKILNEVTRYSDRSSHESRQVVEQLRGLFISKKASDQTSFSACEIRQVSGNTTVSRGKVPSPSVHPAPPPSYTSQATSLPAGYVSVGGVAVPLSLIGSPSPTTPGNFGLPLGLPFSSGDGGNRGRVVGSKRDTSRSTPRLSTIGTTGMNRSLGRITGMHVSTSRLSPISGPSGNPGIYRSFGKLGPGPGTGNTPHLSIYSPSSGGPKTVRSRLMLDSLGPSSGGANPRLTEAGSMSIFSAPYTVTESTVPVAKVANITPTLSTSGSLAAIRDEKDNLTDFVHCSMMSSIQQSENQFRLSLASHGTVAPSTCNLHSVISILEPGSNNNKIQHENPFTAAYQLFEQNQENLQISSEASQNDKTNVAEPTSLESNASSTTWKGVIRRKRSGQGSLSRKLVRSAVSPETLTEIPTIQKQNSEGALNTDNVNQERTIAAEFE